MLPFLVVHGWWIQWVAVLVCGLIGLAAVETVRWFRERARARAEVGAWDADVTSPKQGDVTVRGSYRERGDERWVQCGDERLVLTTPPEVVRGRRARWPHRAREPIHEVDDGDDVIARGQLARVAAGEQAAATYREESAAWAYDKVELMATQPALPPRPLTKLAVFMPFVLVVSCFVGYLALRSTGKSLADTEIEYGQRRNVTTIPTRLAVAAALPGSRGKALEQIDRLIDRRFPYTRRTIALTLQLARLRHGCRGAARVLFKLQRFAEARAEAEACGAADLVVDILLAAGRYEQAAARIDRDLAKISLDVRVVAALGAGRWRDAALAADGVVAQARNGKFFLQPSPEHTARVVCATELFRSYGGDREAEQRLVAAAKTDRFCQAMLALVRKDPNALIRARKRDAYSFVDHYTFAWALGAQTKYRATPSDAASALTLFPHYSFELALLAPFARAVRRGPDTHAWMAAYHMLENNTAAALTEARLADRLIPPQRRGMELAVRLRAGQSAATSQPARFGLESWSRLRSGQPLTEEDHRWLGSDSLYLRPEDCVDKAELRQAIAARDGGLLARVFTECRVMWNPVSRLLLALLPAVSKGRAALRAAVPRFLRGSMLEISDLSYPGAFRLRWLNAVWVARDIARLAGDDERAVAWQAVLDRHLAAYRHRDRLIALLVWRSIVL